MRSEVAKPPKPAAVARYQAAVNRAYPTASPWVTDLTNLESRDGTLLGAGMSMAYVRDMAPLLNQGQVNLMTQWAAAYPHMDARTWIPLTQMGIDPHSPEAQKLAHADLIGQVQSGTFGNVLGQTHNGAAPPQTDPAVAPDGTDSGFLSAIGHAAQTAIGTTYDAVKGAERTTVTALSAPIQGGEATARIAASRGDAYNQAYEKYGLNTDRLKFAVNGTIALDDPHGPQYTEDEKARILAAQTYAEGLMNTRLGGKSVAESIVAQTDLGQVIKDPSLLTQTYPENAVYDPHSDQYVIPQRVPAADGIGFDTRYVPANKIPEEGWLPNHVAVQQSAQEALRVYNITTAQEAAQGVQPMAWTPGRAVAHIWATPDTTAFNAISGFVDLNKSLFLDPVNLIPADPIIKGARAVTALGSRAGRALPLVGEHVPIATSEVTNLARQGRASTLIGVPNQRFGAIGSPLDLVPQRALGNAAAQTAVGERMLAGTKATQGIGPILYDEASGRLAGGPFGKVVVNQKAWDYMSRGVGAKIADAVAAETSPTKIILASNRQIDTELAQTLARTRTPDEARIAIATRLGAEIQDGRALTGLAGLARPPALSGFRLLDGWGARGASLAGGGVFSKAGRSATWENYAEHGVGGAARGLYRRPFRMSPRQASELKLEDSNDTLTQIERFARGARMTNDEWIPHADAYLAAGNHAEKYQAIFGDQGLMGTLEKKLAGDFGVDATVAHKITRAFQGGLDPNQVESIQHEIGLGNSYSAGGDYGGVMFLADMLGSTAHLPSYRDMARATSTARTLMTHPGIANATQHVDDFIQGVTTAWRNSVLMRPAFIIRNVGEQGFAGGLAGLDSAFTHPYSFIGHVMQYLAGAEVYTLGGRAMKSLALGEGAEGHLAGLAPGALTQARKVGYEALAAPAAGLKAVGATPETVEKVADWIYMHAGMSQLMPAVDQAAVHNIGRVTGGAFWKDRERAIRGEMNEADIAEMFKQSAMLNGNFLIDERGAKLGAKQAIPIVRDNVDTRPLYVNKYIEKLSRLASDPVGRALADTTLTRDEVYEKFLPHVPVLQAMRMPNPLLNAADHSNYLDAAREVMHKLTVGQSDLMDAVAKGTFDGKALTADNTALRNRLGELLDDPVYSQAMSPSLIHLAYPTSGVAGLVSKGKQGADAFFQMSGEFDDVFMRGPGVRQFYTDKVLELAPHMSSADLLETAGNLRRAGDTRLARKVLLKAKVQRGKKGILTAEDVDAIASTYARKRTAKTFYDAHERQNWATALRAVSPFAQATFNTLKRWGALSMQNPNFMYRTLKPIDALTQPGSASIYDIIGSLTGDKTMQSYYTPNNPAPTNVNGFFFSDSTGERRFAYPFVGPLISLFAPNTKGLQMTSYASGLNIAGNSVNPGLGPMGSLSAALLPHDYLYEKNTIGDAARFIFPYGIPEGSALSRIFSSVAPTALNKVVGAGDEEKNANNTALVMQTLLASGAYDMSKTGDQARLVNDAGQIATRMGVLAGVFGSITPSTLQLNPQILASGDATGNVEHMLTLARLNDEFRKYTATDYNAGLAQFVKDYGGTALLSVLPRTTTDGPVATDDIWEFRTEEPQAYTEHRGVIGLFFKSGAEAAFSPTLYQWQKASGERGTKDPQEYLQSVNRALGWMLWDAGTNQIMQDYPKNQQGQARALLREEIQNKMPGWTGRATDLGDFDNRMKQVRDALDDPAIQTLPSAYWIGAYVKSRDSAIAEYRAQTGDAGTLTTKAATPYRERLFYLASEMMKNDTTGGFATAWNQLFSGEFTNEQAAEVTGG